MTQFLRTRNESISEALTCPVCLPNPTHSHRHSHSYSHSHSPSPSPSPSHGHTLALAIAIAPAPALALALALAPDKRPGSFVAGPPTGVVTPNLPSDLLHSLPSEGIF